MARNGREDLLLVSVTWRICSPVFDYLGSIA